MNIQRSIFLFMFYLISAGEVVPVFLPANVVHRGLTREEGALLMSIYGVMFAASQLVVGMIADLLHVPISYILAVSMIALTLTSVAIPFCYTFLAFAFCTGVFAIFHGKYYKHCIYFDQKLSYLCKII